MLYTIFHINNVSRERMRPLFLAMVLMCFPTLLLAQNPTPLKFAVGGGKPDPIGQIDCFLDTLGHEGWNQFQGQWYKLRLADVSRIEACGDYLIFDGAYTDQVIGPQSYSMMAYQIHCSDSVMVMIYAETIIVAPKYLVHRPQVFVLGGQCKSKSHEMQLVNGIEAYCCATFVYGFRGECSDRRDYGMFGINGQWLVEPKFDEPFRFENGFAWVKYYGQNRKINERGEFVD